MIKLFSDIYITRGYYRSVLQDLGRNEYYFIPNSMVKFIKDCDGKNEYSNLQRKYADSFEEYFSFLEDKELIFDIDKHFLANFPPIDVTYEFPYSIINISILFSNKNMQIITQAFENNVFINVINLHFFIPNHISFKNIHYLIEVICSKSAISIQIEIGKMHVDFESFNNLMINNSLIKVIPHNREITFNYLESKEYGKKYPFFLNQYIQYYEATKYNTFLNKRIYIDSNGNIKLTPKYDLILGNINNLRSTSDLDVLVENKDYKNICNVHCGMIEICKDCELRMMCIDDKIPIKNEKFWLLKEECSYNPYICKWKNEEGYLPVTECGLYDKEKGFQPDHEKIEKLNQQLWGNDNE